MHGTMLWFNQVKDLGAIEADAGEELCVYGNDFMEGERPTGRCRGAAVTFGVTELNQERKATDVSFVREVAPRRARMRRGRFSS